MKKIIYLLTILMFFSFTIKDLNIIKDSRKIDFKKMVKEVSKDCDVLFVGEKHDDPKAHFVEIEILKKLFEKKEGKIILSLEMFERDVQNVLDNYLEETIDEAEFLEKSRPWNNYKNDYRPLIEFARENNIKVIASNVPRRYAAMVARGGLKALENIDEESKKYIAEKVYSDFPEYKERFFETMKDMPPQMKKMGGENLKQKIYLAQCLKDSTMAESIIKYQNKYKDYLVIHVNGKFHSDYHLGTVIIVKTMNTSLIIKNISILKNFKSTDKIDQKIADYIIY